MLKFDDGMHKQADGGLYKISYKLLENGTEQKGIKHANLCIQ